MIETTPSSASGGNGATAQADDMIQRMATTAHQAVDRMAAAAAPAVERLRSRASDAGETLKAKADELGAIEEQWIASARNYVREHPLTAVAVGVMVGVLIGKLTGHGRHDD